MTAASPLTASPSAVARRLTAGADLLVVAGVTAVAWWTVLFHVAVPLDWHRDLVGALWVGGLLVLAALATRPWGRSEVEAQVRPVLSGPRLAVAGVVGLVALAAVVSALGWTADRPAWWLFWTLMTAAAAGALVLVVRAPAAPVPSVSAPGAERVALGGVLLVLAVALLAAAGSALVQRPDADDVFLVNRSTYVAEHAGSLPDRDTLFSDEVFAVTRPDAVPTSFESMIGVLAAWAPVTAPTLTYLVIGPAAAALGMLALWRMLRTLGARAPALAVALTGAYLVLDGASTASFGNFSFGRSWQGKVVFLIVVVPSLWHHALRWTRDGSRRDGWLLLVANVAGIGLTTTAVLLGPAVTAVAALGGAWGSGAWRRLPLALAAALPAAVAAAAFTVVPDQDPSPVLGTITGWVPPWFTLSGGIDPGQLWHFVHKPGAGLLLPVVAAGTAWLLVPDRSACVALVLAPAVLFGVVYGPGSLDALAEVSGARSILWRTGWILPVPAAVGLLLTAPFALFRAPRWQRLGTALWAGALLVVMAVGSAWVLAADGGTQGVHVGRPAWDVDPSHRTAAERLVDLSDPGDAILAPERISQVVAIQTTRVRALNPRSQYMTGRHTVPEFGAEARQGLTQAVTFGAEPHQATSLALALADLEVATVCTTPTAQASATLVDALREHGLAPVADDDHCTYWRPR